MLIKKMFRDMKKSKVQFISIFLMSFLAVFIYSGLGSESRGYEVTLANYYSETNLADYWLYGTNFTAADEATLLEMPEIKDVSRRLYVTGNAVLENNPVMYMIFQENDTVCKTQVIEGSPFDPTDADGVWVDNNFAEALELKIGDQLELTCQGISITKKIRGFVISPEYIYMQTSQMIPDHSKYGFVYLSKYALPLSMQEVSNQMVITQKDSFAALENEEKAESDQASFENMLYEKLPENKETQSSGLSIIIAREDLPSHSVFLSEIEERKSMTAVFPIAFLAIVLLTILTTMSRMVQYQRTQIGVLKALGFTKRTITNHYVGYSFLLTLFGGCLGAILGPLILPPLFVAPMKTVYTLPEWKSSFLPSTYGIISVMCVLSVLITYSRCRVILHETAAASLRPKTTRFLKHRWFEKTKGWEKLSFGVQWNIRDILRSKVRSIMAIAGVTGCMGLLITGFGAMDAFDGLVNIKYDTMSKYENRINLEEGITDRQINDIQTSVQGELLMEDIIEVRYGEKKESTKLTVNDQVTMIQYLDLDWQPAKLSDTGINLSYGLAKKLGIKTGDTISWHRYGENAWTASVVVCIYRDPQEQGITISREAFEDYQKTFVPTAMLTAEQEVADQPGIVSVENIEESAASINKMLKSMYLLIGIICVAACVLAIVVLYNLGVLSFAEKERELATLKVLGIQGNKIRRLLLMENSILTVIGLLPGYYFGLAMLNIIMYSVGNEFDFRILVEPDTLMISIVITMVLSVLVNYVFSARINRLDMVASLKGVE